MASSAGSRLKFEVQEENSPKPDSLCAKISLKNLQICLLYFIYTLALAVGGIITLGKVAKCSRTVQVFFKKRKKTLRVILKGVQGEF